MVNISKQLQNEEHLITRLKKSRERLVKQAKNEIEILDDIILRRSKITEEELKEEIIKLKNTNIETDAISSKIKRDLLIILNSIVSEK